MSAIKKAKDAELRKNLKHAEAGGMKRVAKEIAAELQQRTDQSQALMHIATKQVD
jgi:hypothetical protein